MRLYLDTAVRGKIKVKLLKSNKVVDEMLGVEDAFAGISEILKRNDLTIESISRVDVNRGPGSFTGLKVGVTIANIFNYFKGGIKSWRDLVLPEYGEEPHISKSKKLLR